MGIVSAVEHGPNNILFHQKRRQDRFGHFVVTKFRTLGEGNELAIPVPGLLQDYFDFGIDNQQWLEHLSELNLWDEYDSIAARQHGLVQAEASPVGNALRILGLDEAIQFLPVILGRESLVGARSQIDPVLVSRLVADPILFNEWFSGPYSEKKGLVSAGTNFYHRNAPRGHLDSREIIRRVLRLDIESHERASLQEDLRVLAAAPINIIAGLGHHLLRYRKAIEPRP